MNEKEKLEQKMLLTHHDGWKYFMDEVREALDARQLTAYECTTMEKLAEVRGWIQCALMISQSEYAWRRRLEGYKDSDSVHEREYD